MRRGHDGNLLAAAIVAARARASLGEISAAMEDVFGRHAATTRVISASYGTSYGSDPQYGAMLRRLAQFRAKHERAPSLFIAKMGQDGHDRGAKIIASAFADLGFDVHMGDLFETAAEVVAHVAELRVDAVGVSSLAAGHKTLVPELIGELRRQGLGEVMVIVGGVIPEQDYPFLRAAGVAEIFGPGTNVLEAAFAVLNQIEGRLGNRMSLRMWPTAHPTLRATFSRKGRRKVGTVFRRVFPLPSLERVPAGGVRGGPRTLAPRASP